MAGPKLAQYINELSTRSEIRCDNIFLKSVEKRCTPAIYKLITELANAVDDRLSYWNVVIDYCSEDCRDDLREVCASIEEQSVYDRAVDDAIDAKRMGER